MLQILIYYDHYEYLVQILLRISCKLGNLVHGGLRFFDQLLRLQFFLQQLDILFNVGDAALHLRRIVCNSCNHVIVHRHYLVKSVFRCDDHLSCLLHLALQ